MKFKDFLMVVGITFLFVISMLTFQHFSVGAQQGIRGPISGDMWVPSAFRFIFGDILVAADDIYLQKNGAFNLGISGHVGGSTATANTTTTPAGNWAWGTVALPASTTVTVTFAKTFVVAPVCTLTDQTNTGVTLRSVPTASTLVITASASSSDVIAYSCFGNPN